LREARWSDDPDLSPRLRVGLVLSADNHCGRELSPAHCFDCVTELARRLDNCGLDRRHGVGGNEMMTSASETGSPRQLATLSIQQGLNVDAREDIRVVDLHLASGSDPWWLCVDGQPHSSFRTLEEAQSARDAIESGEKTLLSFWRTSTGIGDVIALAAAAVILAERNGGILLPVKLEYLASIKSIFVNHPEVEFIDAGLFCKNPTPNNLFISKTDLWLRDTGIDQYQRIYQHFGIPYSERWDSSPVLKACEKVEQIPVPDVGPYKFMHDDQDRGYRIDLAKVQDGTPIYVPKVVEGRSILAYKDLLENATKIHVIDSSFYHLTEQLNPRGRLFFHRYARGNYQAMNNDYEMRHAWEILP
jgi:hypothetical protein